MTMILCQPLVWTDIPGSSTDQIIEARERGLYVDTTGALNVAERAQGYALPGGQSMVVSAGLFLSSVRVIPANDLKATSVRHIPV